MSSSLGHPPLPIIYPPSVVLLLLFYHNNAAPSFTHPNAALSMPASSSGASQRLEVPGSAYLGQTDQDRLFWSTTTTTTWLSKSVSLWGLRLDTLIPLV